MTLTLGHARLPTVIDAATCDKLLQALGPVKGAGRRGLLADPVVSAIAHSKELLDCVGPHLAMEPKPVRAIYFDKSLQSNWLVPWHQDLSVALAAKAEVDGFGPWSIKQGIPHAQAPAAILEQMITIRLHLDDTTAEDGPLKVISGSHTMGVLTAEQISALRSDRPHHTCVASRGDVMLMKPLLLHASSKSTSASHRRILHLEYAGFDLPRPLQWYGMP